MYIFIIFHFSQPLIWSVSQRQLPHNYFHTDEHKRFRTLDGISRFFLLLLYGTFTSSITLLRAEFDTTPFLLNELESRFIGLCYCALVAGAAAAEVSAARCRGHGWPLQTEVRSSSLGTLSPIWRSQQVLVPDTQRYSLFSLLSDWDTFFRERQRSRARKRDVPVNRWGRGDGLMYVMVQRLLIQEQEAVSVCVQG